MRDEFDGRCPGCRSKYEESKFRFETHVEKELSVVKPKHHTLDLPKEAANRVAARQIGAGASKLRGVRVVQRNVAVVFGLPPHLAHEHKLRRDGNFGQYGKITKLVVSRPNSRILRTRPGDAGASAYVTFARYEDAAYMIRAVDCLVLDGRALRCSFGTTKYCKMFLASRRCNNPRCVFMHELGHAAAAFTKEDMLKLAFKGAQVAQVGSEVSGRCPSIFPPRGCSARRWMDIQESTDLQAPRQRRTLKSSDCEPEPFPGGKLIPDANERSPGQIAHCVTEQATPSTPPTEDQFCTGRLQACDSVGVYGDYQQTSNISMVNSGIPASENGLGDLLKSINDQSFQIAELGSAAQLAAPLQSASDRTIIVPGDKMQYSRAGAYFFTPQFYQAGIDVPPLSTGNALAMPTLDATSARFDHNSHQPVLLPDFAPCLNTTSHAAHGRSVAARSAVPQFTSLTTTLHDQPVFDNRERYVRENGHTLHSQGVTHGPTIDGSGMYNIGLLPAAAKKASERATRAAEAVARVVGGVPATSHGARKE